MPKIRVLIVDDAALIRKMLGDVLADDPDIEVVGTAANGKIALQKIPQCNPDILTLDVEMPELSGIETLKEIRKAYPKLPVIMFSSMTQRGAETTIDALSAGASDYACKPVNVRNKEEAKTIIRDELIDKIKALTPVSRLVPQVAPRSSSPAAPSVKAVRPKSNIVDIVAIGVSTGGPNALNEVIPEIPKDFPVPIVLVQHMPPFFTKTLAERLDQKSALTIVEAEPGMQLAPGSLYIAPGDYHMELKRNGLGVEVITQQGPRENSCRPAVDVLFRSVVSLYQEAVLGVILTGMGQDGLRGCEYIVEAGGQVIVQDKASSVVWGMPGYVAEAGLADVILPLSEVSGEIISKVSRGKRKGS